MPTIESRPSALDTEREMNYRLGVHVSFRSKSRASYVRKIVAAMFISYLANRVFVSLALKISGLNELDSKTRSRVGHEQALSVGIAAGYC